MDDKLKERLQKLRNLAERGVGGERETAEKKLQALLNKNGLSEEDLSDDKPKYYLFSYQFPYRKKLLCQIIYKILGDNGPIQYYRSKGTRNKVGVYCTPAQKLEIDLDFEFYSNIFDEELQTFLLAFIDKQDIYPKDVEVTEVRSAEMTDEERRKFMQRQVYANNINKRTRSLMIEDRNNE